MKNILLVIVLSTIPMITIGQKSNLRFSSGIDFGSTPPTHYLTAHYINPTIDILDELIKLFGKSYSVRGDSYFYWENVKIEKLSRKPLDITIVKRVNSSSNDNHEFYEITIRKKGKQFLREIAFWNRLKVKRVFRNFEETI